ncbi:hypothetical protein KKB55_11535, partial [Myxococcota bacterium]|nr:hypothetical protein [Myxococcota bacterium]
WVALGGAQPQARPPLAAPRLLSFTQPRWAASPGARRYRVIFAEDEEGWRARRGVEVGGLEVGAASGAGRFFWVQALDAEGWTSRPSQVGFIPEGAAAPP